MVFRTVLYTAALLVSLFSVANAFAFAPCSSTTPKGISYLPEAKECGGTAAIVAYGKYANIFSAVVRDCNNNDRDPCFKSEGTCAANEKSPFKAQKILRAIIKTGGRSSVGQVFCLKERGDSKVYKLVRRITIKMRDPVKSEADIKRFCLSSRVTAKNPVTIGAVRSVKNTTKVGYSAICDKQPYLSCSIEYADVCPSYK